MLSIPLVVGTAFAPTQLVKTRLHVGTKLLTCVSQLLFGTHLEEAVGGGTAPLPASLAVL